MSRGSLHRRLERLERERHDTQEPPEKLVERMFARTDVVAHPGLVAAYERVRAVNPDAGHPPPLSDAAQHLAEHDTSEQRTADARWARALQAQGHPAFAGLEIGADGTASRPAIEYIQRAFERRGYAVDF